MKIQNELLTGVVSQQQQLNKTGQAQPETDFAALLAEELAQGQAAGKMLPGIKDIAPLAGLAGLDQSQPLGGFSPEEDQLMDEISGLLEVVDAYGLALAGQGEDGANGQDTSLKSIYNLLETIAGKSEELKGALARIGNNPVLAGIVNELEVMAATEKFKLNRGDYTV